MDRGGYPGNSNFAPIGGGRGGSNFAPRGDNAFGNGPRYPSNQSRGGGNFAPRGDNAFGNGPRYQSRGGGNFAPRGDNAFGNGPRYQSNQSRGAGAFGSSFGQTRPAFGSSAPIQPSGPSGKVVPFNQCLNGEIAPAKNNEQVLINSYNVRLPQRPVYLYELKFFGERADGSFDDLSLTPTRGVEASLHRECITKLYEVLLFAENGHVFQTDRENNGVFEHVYAYDRSSIFFSSLQIEDHTDDNPFIINTGHINRDILAYIHRPRRVFATLKLGKQISLNPQAPDEERVMAQYLDILLTQNQLDEKDGRFAKFGPKMFDLKTGYDISGAAELKDGHQKSVRLSKTGAQLQVDAKISPFHSVGHLHEYVKEKWGFLFNHNWLTGQIHRTLGELKGMYVSTMHKRNSEVFRIFGVTEKSADQIFFKDRQNQDISVAAYFESFYGKQLMYPQLPCVIKKVGVKMMYYPFEYLQVLKGQKIPKESMNKQQEEKMIRASQRLPLDVISEIEKQMNIACIRDDDPYIAPAQIQISTAMNSVTSEALHPPIITYKGDAPKQVNFAQWDIRDVQFVKPAEIFALAIFFHTGWLTQAKADEVAGKINQQATRLGMKIHTKQCFPLEENQVTRAYLEKTITEFRDQFNCDFVLAFAPGSEFHHMLKATEVVTNVPTQQVEPKTVNNPKLGAVTLGNIIQKMNPKNGGYNQYFRQAVPSQISGESIDLFQSFMQDAMVMGLCLSHPAPGGKEGQSSVCGYAFSTNKRGNVSRGGFVYMKARETILSDADLRKPLEDAVNLYHKENQCYPQRVLIYRFGSSDGEIQRIQNEECVSIMNGLIASMNGIQPKLNVILVRSQHNTRIFKQRNEIDTRARAPEQNVKPGSCTRGATDADIVMVPHRALQGTAKPTVFSNIFPDPHSNDLSENFLKNITHSFCYMHEIVDSAISVPHVLRSAEQMANRGKNLWHSKSNELPHSAPEEFLFQATNLLNPQIPTRYWA